MTKKITALKSNELYMLEFNSGYHYYYAFGKDHAELFKRIVQMYNRNARSKYNTATFRKLCPNEGYYLYLYKVDMTLFAFDDDYQYNTIDRNGGTSIGDYLKLTAKESA